MTEHGPGNGEMLLVKTAVKAYIKARAHVVRPGWIPSQISEDAMQQLNHRLKKIIDHSLHAHPSKGKTFRQIM